jgi:hypothetical protein
MRRRPSLQWRPRGPAAFKEDQFKVQGRFSTGDRKGTQVAISAFKVSQLRVYGGFVPGRRGEFLCTEITRTKKRNEADKGTLERAARRLGEFAGE